MIIFVQMFLRQSKKPEKEADDVTLIGLYRDEGDRNALGMLFERYTHLVFGVCMKYLKDQEESKDAVMQIFEKLMDDLKTHEISNFSSWLHTVSRNFCLMKLRSAQTLFRRQEAYGNYEQMIMESTEGLHPSEVPAKERELQLLEEALNELGQEQKECVMLFYIEKKSYAEISSITGYDMNKVKSFIQNGKRNLRIRLEKEFKTRGD